MIKKLFNVKKEEDSDVLEMCRKCYAFRQSNSWHLERPEYFLENEVEEKTVRFVLCSPCFEQAQEEYETLYDMEYA